MHRWSHTQALRYLSFKRAELCLLFGPPLGGASETGGLQVMGPGDSYLVQHSRDAGCFWGDPSNLALGACFRTRQAAPPRHMVNQVRPDALRDWPARSSWPQQFR